MRKQNLPKTTAKPPARRNKLTFNNKGWQRQLLVIFIISFFISTALILYVFGFPDGFFLRLFNATFVFFLLIGSVVLGIIPVVNYAFQRWLR